MQLDLEVPERLVRKLKALNALEGGLYAANIESLILSMMEEAVNIRILELMEVPARPVASTPLTSSALQGWRPNTNSSTIADDLGDDELPPETDEEALVPTSGGLTDEDLDHDLEVGDPEHEAAEEASEFPDSIKSDDIFSKVVGIPMPTDDEMEEDAHVAKRRHRPKLKAKVRAMNEDYDSSSF